MSSTDKGGSVGSSIFIPNWVKNSSGFDPSALSPPTHDGEFFYVRFPRFEKSETSDKVRDQTPIAPAAPAAAAPTPLTSRPNLNKFIPKIEDTVTVVKPGIGKISEALSREGMSSSAAASSSSIVAVAEQMVAGNCKPPIRGFATDDASAAASLPPSAYHRQRRNSKSLPASPLMSPETSPRTRRKNITGFKNRYLAGSTEAGLNESEENLDRKSGSYWILAGLFSGQKDNNRLAVVSENQQNSLAAEARTAVASLAATAASMSTAESSPASNNVNLTVEVKSKDSGAPSATDKRGYLKKKRSEIRELNFISPVSM